jgi:hypothetical protein
MAAIAHSTKPAVAREHTLTLQLSDNEVRLLHDLVDVPLADIPPFIAHLRRELGQIIRKEGLS